MTVLLTVAIGVRVTLLETLRRRTVWALVALTAVVVLLSGLGFGFLVRESRARGTSELDLLLGLSQVLILCAFMFSFILAATAAFIGAPAIAADIESGVLLAILARPIGRAAWLVGRWAGLAVVVAAYGVAAGLGEIAAMRIVSGYGPPDPLGAAGGLAAQAVVVLTVTVLLGTRLPAIASGAIAVVLFGLAWGLGVLGGVGSALGVDLLESVGRIVRFVFPSDGLWRATIHALEPSSVIALMTEGRSLRVLQANPFFALTGPSAGLPRLVPDLGRRRPRPGDPVVPAARAVDRPGYRGAMIAPDPGPTGRARTSGDGLARLRYGGPPRRLSGSSVPMTRSLVAAVLIAFGLLFPSTVAPAPAAAAAPAVNPKVVIVVGPVGSYTAHYKADADALAAVARRYTRNVVVIKTPRATWTAVRAAAQGASILIYLGHGNGWPSRYRDALWPFTQNGFGLDPPTGANGTTHVYYGEAQVGSEIRLAPNAVVLLFHLCYASGNTEPGLATGTLADKRARVENYGAGFFAAGARAVIADAYHPQTTYLTRLFTSSMGMNALFHAAPTYHGHDIAWDSFRTTGARAIMDPTSVSRGPWYHSAVFDPGLTAAMVTRTAYRPTDLVPTTITVGGAGDLIAAGDLSADPALGTVLAPLEAGRRMRIVAEAGPLADGSRVVRVHPFDAPDLVGYLRADAMTPVDGTPATLYDYDPPGALIGPNGDYVFDTFHVVVRASEPLDGTIEIRDAGGAVVRTLTGGDAWSVFDWDLRGSGGVLIPDGTYTWSYTGREPAGNDPAPFARSGRFVLDATDPQTTSNVTGTLHPSGWYTTAATVTLSAHDALSGMRGTSWSLDGGPATRYTGPVVIGRSGDHRLRYWSTDRAGNVETTRTVAVKVDVTAPVTTPVLDGPVGEAGWFRDDVSVGLSATDAQSGVASTVIGIDGAALAPYTGPIVVTEAGSHTVAYRSVDVTGRTEAVRTTRFTIDRTPPTIGPDGSVVASRPMFSPNGDGVADTVAVSHAIDEPGAVRLVVTPAAGGTALRTLTVSAPKAGPGAVTWDGRDDAGAVVPDGDYRLTLTPLDRARNAGPAASVTVTVFTSFVGLAASPARFFPQDGDAIAPRTAAAFTLRAPADVRLQVRAAGGAVVRTIAASRPAGSATIAWDGRNDAGALVPQGVYRMEVRATVGDQTETHVVAVRAAAFEIRPSVSSGRRGSRLTVTVVSTEPLTGAVRLTIRQPGLAPYWLNLSHVSGSTYRAAWTLHRGGRTGAMSVTVAASDRSHGRNSTTISMGLR